MGRAFSTFASLLSSRTHSLPAMVKFGEDVPISALKGAKQPIVTITNTDTVRSALEKLAKASVLSAPYLKDGKCVGFVDVTDIISFLIHGVYKMTTITGDQGQATVDALVKASLNHHDFASTGALAKAFFEAPVTSLPNHSGGDSFQPFPPTANLAQMIGALAAGASRIPIVDETGTVVNVISQSTVTHYLADSARQQSNAAVKALCEKTLADLGLAVKPVVRCSTGDRTIDVFCKMHEHKVSAVALVEGNHVSGNISAKDIREILNDFSYLLHPVGEYVNIIRRRALKAVYPSITVRPTDAFGHAVAKLAVCGIHRLYVTDTAEANSNVIGVVSLRDVVLTISKL